MRRLSALLLASAFLALPLAATAAPAQTELETAGPTHVAPAPLMPVIPYAAINPGEPYGDRLIEARRLAAAIVAQDKPAPHRIVDVGSFTGEFLEAFMAQFPQAPGQWTEPVDRNINNARNRLRRYGKRVDFVIGCPARDPALPCVPADTDVLLSSWLSIHQDRAGIARFYARAHAILPEGGWIAVIDHVGSNGDSWEKWLHAARPIAVGKGLASQTEGPPVHHPDWTVPSLDDQLNAMRAGGFTDPRVVWRRLDTVLLMARKGAQ